MTHRTSSCAVVASSAAGTAAMSLRPILAGFGEAFPLSRFAITRERSWGALDALEAGDLGLALADVVHEMLAEPWPLAA